MGIPRRLGERLLIPVARRFALLQHISAFVEDHLGPNGYGHLKERFIRNGRHSPWGESLRAEIAARFERIQEQVPIQSSRADFLVVGEAALSLGAAGDFVECGCFAGGSTAKLSILARIMGRKLHVFDSFEGIPTPDAREAIDFHLRRSEALRWQQGACRATLDQVRSAVEAYGEPSVCSYHPGWFKDTLMPRNLPHAVALAYTDVVLPSSAGECLRSIWPLMPDRAVYFSRDLALTNVLQALLDEGLWRDVLKEFPPIVFGAGFGMRDASQHLGMMVKGKTLPATYLDSLMVDKAAAQPHP